ncbi:MAG: hypothetical protein NUV63_12865 [Gallionella sp.]|nr:hypothetical protein [Gallionella sp.]
MRFVLQNPHQQNPMFPSLVNSANWCFSKKACEALFALPHKASFDAGQSRQHFAVLNKTIAIAFEKGKETHALQLLPHSCRRLSRRTARSSGHHAMNSVEAHQSVMRDAA